jgi:hypothetical protein
MTRQRRPGGKTETIIQHPLLVVYIRKVVTKRLSLKKHANSDVHNVIGREDAEPLELQGNL